MKKKKFMKKVKKKTTKKWLSSKKPKSKKKEKGQKKSKKILRKKSAKKEGTKKRAAQSATTRLRKKTSKKMKGKVSKKKTNKRKAKEKANRLQNKKESKKKISKKVKSSPVVKSKKKLKTQPMPKEKKALSKKELIESIRIAEDYNDIEEVVLTDAEGNVLCKVRDCDEIATTEGYCRYHYLMHWKMIQRRREILKSGKLQEYIDNLTSYLPDKYIKLMRKDLSNEKDFMMAIQQLNIDNIYSGVDDDSLVDESQDITSRSTKESDDY